jgi:hypothetical protein
MKAKLRSALFASALLSWACAGGDETAGGAAHAGRPSPGARGAAGDIVDLQAMLSEVPEYEGVGRNLFAFGAARRAGGARETAEPTEPLEPSPPPQVVAAPPPRTPRVPGASPAPRLNMKYAGFLEKTAPDGNKKKYAIFLDGNEVLAGSEGEVVGNRFTVVEIGLESVTVSASGSSATQRIPLQSK